MRFPKTTVYTEFCHCSAFYSGGVEPDGGADRRTGPHATRPGAAGPHAGAGGLGRNEALATSRRRQGRDHSPESVERRVVRQTATNVESSIDPVASRRAFCGRAGCGDCGVWVPRCPASDDRRDRIRALPSRDSNIIK